VSRGPFADLGVTNKVLAAVMAGGPSTLQLRPVGARGRRATRLAGGVQ
jgi:hypothetical protein